MGWGGGREREGKGGTEGGTEGERDSVFSGLHLVLVSARQSGPVPRARAHPSPSESIRVHPSPSELESFRTPAQAGRRRRPPRPRPARRSFTTSAGGVCPRSLARSLACVCVCVCMCARARACLYARSARMCFAVDPPLARRRTHSSPSSCAPAHPRRGAAFSGPGGGWSKVCRRRRGSQRRRRRPRRRKAEKNSAAAAMRRL